MHKRHEAELAAVRTEAQATAAATLEEAVRNKEAEISAAIETACGSVREVRDLGLFRH